MTTMTSQHTRTDIAALLKPAGAAGRKPRRLLVWITAIVTIAAVAIAAAVLLRSNQAQAASPYLTEVVMRGDLDVEVSATGTLQPTNTVEVGSELSGLIETVLVDDNDPVTRGQVLAQLDTSKLRDQITRSEAALASAEAGLAQAEASVKEATANLERLQEVSRLSGGKVPSKAEMESAEATLARAEGARGSARAAVTEARATLSSDQTNLSKASIRSPINGIVLNRAVEPGQTVAASLQVATLFTIAEDLRQMELEVNVDEADVGRVKEGQAAIFRVDAHANRSYSAHVTRVAYGSTKVGDVVSYVAVLGVQNDDLSLRPGMTASAEISSASVKDALLVPNAALRFTPTSAASQGTGRGFVGQLLPGPPRQQTSQTTATPVAGEAQQVWVLRNGMPVAVPVDVGQSDGRYTEVVSGDLSEGIAVITEAGATS